MSLKLSYSTLKFKFRAFRCIVQSEHSDLIRLEKLAPEKNLTLLPRVFSFCFLAGPLLKGTTIPGVVNQWFPIIDKINNNQ